MQIYTEELLSAIDKKNSRVCVGLDPDLGKIPSFLCEGMDILKPDAKKACDAILTFNKGVIDAVFDLVPIFKIQLAYYEIWGQYGWALYEKTLAYAREKGVLVIADAKRGDIGSTSRAYADAFFSGRGTIAADCLTVNPFFGTDGVGPFFESADEYGKGIFLLVKTSNPSSAEFQDLLIDGVPLYKKIAEKVNNWMDNYPLCGGYSNIGAVIGATHPAQLSEMRECLERCFFLVPGYGAQGGTAADIAPAFDKNGTGAILNSSRNILYAYKNHEIDEKNFSDACRIATVEMNKDINTHIR